MFPFGWHSALAERYPSISLGDNSKEKKFWAWGRVQRAKAMRKRERERIRVGNPRGLNGGLILLAFSTGKLHHFLTRRELRFGGFVSIAKIFSPRY